MENHQNAPLMSLLSSSPSVACNKNEISDSCITPTDSVTSCHHFLPVSSDECFVEEKQHMVIRKKKDAAEFDSHFTCKEKIDDSSQMDFSLYDQEEKSVEGLLQSIDISELSFFSNDFLLGDCNCLEQASQLVDPALKDSESTPFSFNNSNSNNNNDLVQLLKPGLNDSNEDYTNLNLHNTINKSKDDCDLSQKDATKLHLESDKVIYLKDNINVQKNIKPKMGHKSNRNNESNRDVIAMKGKKNENELRKLFGGGGPIKRGRRYLPNFKQKVLEYARSHTYKEAASHFQINSNTITEWFREVDKNLSSKEAKVTTTSGESDSSKNHKTDQLGTPIAKTEVILLNDDILLETDYNEPSLKRNKIDLETPVSSSPSSPPSSSSFTGPSSLMKPDEMFLKWVRKKRLEKKELSRQEVFQIAKYCLHKRSGNLEASSWFVPWLVRYNKVLNSVDSNNETEKYIKYPSSFKLEVVLYARSFTKNSAARIFNVSRKRTFDWYSRLMPIDKSKSVASAENFHESNVQIEKNGAEFTVKKDETREKIYSELHLWYQKMVFNRKRPTSNDIKEKAREIFSYYGMKEIKFSDGWLQKFCQRTNIKLRHSEDDELLLWVLSQFDNNVTLSHQDITDKSSTLIGRKRFKGSKGWTLRFLKRHRNLLQRSPTFADQLPRAAQQKLTLFCDTFKQNLASFKVKPENLGCMDEIPLSFSYPEESSSASIPLLRKTGFENCQGIVILSSLANGRLLPPMVIFKGTEPKQWFSIRNLEILVLYQEMGLITVDILETWTKHIWLRYASSPSALVVDSFEPHRAKSLAQMLEKENSLLHVIPEGCSSKFQPLDVDVTPIFKETIKNQWKEFPAGSEVLSSKLGRKYRCPDRNTILHWIQNAYEKVKKNPVSIINSFKTTGLLQSKT